MTLRLLSRPGRLLACMLVWGPAAVSVASPTRSFVIDTQASLSEGKLDGTTIESDGSITAGVQTSRTELPGVPTVKCMLALPDGSAFVGTGNEGKIYVVRGGVAKQFADTKQVMVASLARDAAGTLYAGTLPNGKVFAIDANGNMRELATLPGAEHVWALAYDEPHKTLFAATGPEGKLFAIDAKGKADVYYDSEDEHLMALARGEDGQLYVGTSDRALLVRLRGAGRAEVLYDFEGSEVSAIALRGSQLAVIANQFPKSLKPGKGSTPAPTPAPSPLGATPAAAPAAAPNAPAAGKGQLYVLDAHGHVEQLFATDEGHLASVAWAQDDVLYVGTGKEGRIHRVRVSDREHALLVDLDERQVLAIALAGSQPMFATADGAAVYTATRDVGKREWTSKVLDAGGRARFGQMYTRTRGAVSISTRSGNTDKPDNTWSAWSAPLPAATATPIGASGAITSPPARFLQIRLSLSQADSVVYAVEAYYLQDNQAPVVTEVTVEPPRAVLPAADKAAKPTAAGTQYKLRWKTDNADNDRLRYRLYARREGAQHQRSLLRDGDVLTGTEYTWETEGISDGYYRVRVEASDELDNPATLARSGRGESEPFLIDSHPPALSELRVQSGRIVGRAYDDQGPITRLEYSLDGLDWRLLRTDDDLLDSREEGFSLPLSQLPRGSHAVAVRAADARDNSVTRELDVTVP